MRPGRSAVAALLCSLVALAAAAPATAQQKPTLSEKQRERVLQALHRMDRDTAAADTLGTDTLGVDSLRVRSLRTASDSARPSLPALPADSVTRALLALQGYDAMAYTGAQAHYNADSARIALAGPAQVSRGEQQLAADSLLVYDQLNRTICGYGKPVMQGGAESGLQPVQSQQVCYDVERRVGAARGARTQITQGASWYAHGDLYTAGNDRVYGSGVDFTTCSLEVPHYHFTAKEWKVVRNDVLVARDITLNFADVPVMWLPFMVQSLKQGRHSGLLMPTFSINDVARTNSGYNRKISNLGFYWAVSDHLGAEVTGEWYANNWTALNGSLDFRWLRQFLDGGLTFTRYWRSQSQDLTLATRASWQPNERTNVQLSGSYASSADFVRRNTFDPRELTRSIDSNLGVTRRFDWGTLSLSGKRQQFLSQDKVDLTLPNVAVNVASITLFPAPTARARWYNNATISGSANMNMQRTDFQDLATRLGASIRNTANTTASLQSSFRLGNLSWTQSVNGTRNLLLSKPEVLDTLNVDSVAEAALPRFSEDRIHWQTGIAFQQRLIGTSTISPQLSVNGDLLRQDTLGGGYISAPLRLNVGTSLQTDVYGFFPGFGPFSRIRHRISPSISYTFSPAPTVSDLQRAVFSATQVKETNAITLQLRQSFEAKYKEKPGSDSLGAAGAGAAGGAAIDSLGADSLEAASLGGEPRRLIQAQKVTLLSLTTSALAYDFVSARETGQGFATDRLTNTISSDLLHGLSFSVTHDLFRNASTAGTGTDTGTGTGTDTGTTGGGPAGADVPPPPETPKREFAPHLSSLTTSFSISSDSWLFRKLGLSGGGEREPRPGVNEAATNAGDTTSATYGGELGATSRDELGLIGSAGTQSRRRTRHGPVGQWRANLSYSLTRPRIGEGLENQMIQGNVTLQPTENWNVSWRTGYSITDHRFSDHLLSLTRDLHEWQANFDFVKAQNGNFQFRFRVELTNLPDLHLDYDQHNQPVPAPAPPIG